MEQILLELELLKENVIKSDSKDFYLEIIKYISFLESKKQIIKIIKKLKNQEEKDSRELIDISHRTIKRLKHFKDVIESKNIDNKNLKHNLKEFDKYLNREIRSSAPLTESLYYCLLDIIHHLGQDKIDELGLHLKEIDFEMKDYYQVKTNFENKRRVSEWNYLFELTHLKYCSEKDLKSLELLDAVGVAWMKDEINRVSQGFTNLEKGKREKYTSYLDKLHRYIVKELSNKPKIYFRPWWFVVLILLPFLISFWLYNPFIKYEVEVIKSTDFSDNLNRYSFTKNNILGSINEEDVRKELVSLYVEDITNIPLRYKKYDFYFIDRSEIKSGKNEFMLDYNISINGKIFHTQYKKSMRIIKDINLEEQYNLTMAPQVTFILKSDTAEFGPVIFSPKFYIKNSFEEFLYKTLFFMVIWAGISVALAEGLNKVFFKK